jgi:hypothetical protein
VPFAHKEFRIKAGFIHDVNDLGNNVKRTKYMLRLKKRIKPINPIEIFEEIN